MPIGDVPDLLRRYGGGQGPTALATATDGRVTTQSMDKYLKGQARFLRLPADDTIMGITDALRLGDDTEVLLAFARSGGRLRIRDSLPLLLRELAMVRGVTSLDAHPELVADLVRAIGAVARALEQAAAAPAAD